MSRRSEMLHELRQEMLAAQGYTCKTCLGPLALEDAELAHRIPDAVWANALYGRAVVDHPKNKAMTHRGFCNDQQNIQNRPLECEELAADIRKELAGVKA